MIRFNAALCGNVMIKPLGVNVLVVNTGVLHRAPHFTRRQSSTLSGPASLIIVEPMENPEGFEGDFGVP